MKKSWMGLFGAMIQVSIAFTLWSTVARATGGEGSGGGNTFPQNAASAEDIINEFRWVQPAVSMVFNDWEGTLTNAGVLSSNTYYYDNQPFTGKEIIAVTDLLFGGKNGAKTIFDVLPEIRFVIVTHGPCYDGAGNPTDASAHHINPNEICFSAERLAKKLSKDNLQLPLVALAAHEVSHKLRANERQATLIQARTIQFVIPKAFELASETMRDLRTGLVALNHSLESLEQLAFEGTLKEICIGLQFAASESGYVAYTGQIFGRYGASPIRKKEKDAITGLGWRSVFLSRLCPVSWNKLSKTEIQVPYEQVFAGRQTVAQSEFLENTLCVFAVSLAKGLISALGSEDDKFEVRFDIPGDVHYIKIGDLDSFKAELKEIRSMASALTKYLESLPVVYARDNK